MAGSSRIASSDGAGALVGDLDGALGLVAARRGASARWWPGPAPAVSPSTSRWSGSTAEQGADVGHPVEALDPEGDLHQHLGQLVGLVADGPAPVGGLAPGRPVEAGVDPDPGRALLAGEAVGGLEAHVAQEDVDLEPLLDGLALQQRGLEGVPVGGDELGEDVVQHGGAEATVLPCPPRPEPRRPPHRWPERRVIAYAHQGGAWEGPSSTLHAIAAALEAGATGIELDVHATADGRLVVCHDATVDRTTDGHGADRLVHLRGAVAPRQRLLVGAGGRRHARTRPTTGYPFRGRAPADHRFGFALLEEVLEEFPGVVLNLDIKQTAPVVAPYEEALADLLRRFDCADRVIVASFLDPATDALLGLRPRVPHLGGHAWPRPSSTGRCRPGEDPAPTAPRGPAGAGRASGTSPWWTSGSSRWPTRQGLAVHVWTIEEESEMEELCGLGVDGIITDRPIGPGRGARPARLLRGDPGRERRAGPSGPRRAATGAGVGCPAARTERLRPVTVRDEGRRRRAAGPGGRGQPRPQFGFLPWLAFFLARSLRLLVRFDTVRQG